MNLSSVCVGLCVLVLGACSQEEPQAQQGSPVTAEQTSSDCDRDFIESFAVSQCVYVTRDRAGLERGDSPEASVGKPSNKCSNWTFIYGLGTEASSQFMSSDYMRDRDPTTGAITESAISSGCSDIARTVVEERCSQQPSSCG